MDQLVVALLLPDSLVDPILNNAGVQAIIVVMTTAILTAVAHVGDELLAAVFLVSTRIQEDGAT